MKKSEASREDRWAQALTWYGTLQGADEKQLTTAVGCAWQEWYAHPENRRTFDGVSCFLAERGLYRKRRRRRSIELEQDQYDLSLPVAEWLGTKPPHESAPQYLLHRRRWWLVGSSAIAAASVVVILSVLWFVRSSYGASIAYQTPVGRLREVHLSDGSSITLGGDTKVLVAFSAQRRSVRLIEGQAWFKVAHNPHRPFVVAAGDGTITAVGTAFLVTRDSDRVLVTVTEGAVEVSAQALASISLSIYRSLTARPLLIPVRVSRGEELALGDNGELSSIGPIDTRAATAWMQGRLTFDDQPLRYVIETIDRYSARHIIVSPAAGALRFSGIVFDSQIESWFKSLEAIFPVSVKEQGAVIRIEMRSSTPANVAEARKSAH
ncbi:MAG TPA: FecR domain-containing protein [Steroidobacteraceae bacterium]|jgi:transmembrane sensor|nr:FecR domain-containing protein [Steroidobacteraceae bacterium]